MSASTDDEYACSVAAAIATGARAPGSVLDGEVMSLAVALTARICRCDEADDTADPPSSVHCPMHDTKIETQPEPSPEVTA